MSAALIALALAVATPDEAFDAPPAPRGPGVVALWAGGGMLTVLPATAAISSSDLPFTLTASGGLLAMLGGMMWLVWMQPDEEPKPQSPGWIMLAVGTVHSAAGVLTSPLAAAPGSKREVQDSAVLIATGIAALAAGIAWIIWASR